MASGLFEKETPPYVPPSQSDRDVEAYTQGVPNVI